MDYEKIKEVIAKQIKENGRGEITGPVLQAVLVAMVDSLGEVYPQTYTDEQKAQARANIDALSNYDGEITMEKLSTEVQAILNDVANKQNITDESLATIAKTIVGAINEVYKGGLEDASIATSKIEDGAITEPKLDTDLTAKVNNNVKVVEQTLSDDEVKIASKNLKFRDDNGNFFADKASYDAVAKLSVKPKKSVFGIGSAENIFGVGCERNVFGNKCERNTLGSYCTNCTFGNGCFSNNLDLYCYGVSIGNYCRNNDLGGHLKYIKIDDGVSCVVLRHNATLSMTYLSNIHILSGVYGENDKILYINIPDEYLNSSRELIITTKRTDGGPSTPEDIVMYYADEVVDKQNKQDNTLETTSKEVVGAINELFNGGVKDKSIAGAKLADTAVTTEKIADNSITMEKLKKAQSSFPDIGMAVYHALRIDLKNNNQTGSAILSSVGVNYTEMIDIHVALERIVKTLGAGVTIQVYESDDEGFTTIYLGTVVGLNMIDDEISAIVRNQVDPSKDYFVVINTVNYEFTTKICLTDQLPKIASLETDVTTLQGLINTKVKIITEDTDLNTITEDGLYLLSVRCKYTNYPLSDGTISAQYALLNSPALLIVASRRYIKTQISQVVLSVSRSYLLPLIRTRNYNGTNWLDWNNDYMYKTYNDAENSLDKYQDFLSDIVINNIWDNN